MRKRRLLLLLVSAGFPDLRLDLYSYFPDDHLEALPARWLLISELSPHQILAKLKLDGPGAAIILTVDELCITDERVRHWIHSRRPSLPVVEEQFINYGAPELPEVIKNLPQPPRLPDIINSPQYQGLLSINYRAAVQNRELQSRNRQLEARIADDARYAAAGIAAVNRERELERQKRIAAESRLETRSDTQAIREQNEALRAKLYEAYDERRKAENKIDKLKKTIELSKIVEYPFARHTASAQTSSIWFGEEKCERTPCEPDEIFRQREDELTRGRILCESAETAAEVAEIFESTPQVESIPGPGNYLKKKKKRGNQTTTAAAL